MPDSQVSRWDRWKGPLAYALMIVAGIGGYLLVRSIGEGQAIAQAVETTTEVTEAGPQGRQQLDIVFHVLLTLAAMVALGFILGRLFRYVGQPPVIGEVVAGLCLGPSLLGAISPEAMQLLVPSAVDDPHGQVTAALKILAQLGVVLYMFVVGLELNANKVKDQIHAAVAISHVSIVAPFLLGATLALWLFPRYSPEGISFTSFSLFMGVSMSVTAFPVLARILTDRGLHTTRLGSIALACAAADDATAWCLLALVVGIVQTDITDAAQVGLACGAFIAFMFLVVRPLVQSWCRRMDADDKPLPSHAPILILVGVLVAAITTEVIGVHAIFGAFLMGAMVPNESKLAELLKTQLRDSVTILLLPVFFAYTGLRTQLGLLSGWENWLACGLIIFVATLGKFGGALVAARVSGIRWRDSIALGALMNTRGLMELIVLNIGLDLGVISPELFAMMVVMALVTTVCTAPVLAWLVEEEHEDSEAVTTTPTSRSVNDPCPLG